MEINIKLAESLIDAFDSEETGIVLWDANDNIAYRNKNISERINLIPINRAGKVYELIPLINYIISEENSFLTGEVINFSGGE